VTVAILGRGSRLAFAQITRCVSRVCVHRLALSFSHSLSLSLSLSLSHPLSLILSLSLSFSLVSLSLSLSLFLSLILSLSFSLFPSSPYTHPSIYPSIFFSLSKGSPTHLDRGRRPRKVLTAPFRRLLAGPQRCVSAPPAGRRA
jgi:hypothetical protein